MPINQDELFLLVIQKLMFNQQSEQEGDQWRQQNSKQELLVWLTGLSIREGTEGKESMAFLGTHRNDSILISSKPEKKINSILIIMEI